MTFWSISPERSDNNTAQLSPMRPLQWTVALALLLAIGCEPRSEATSEPPPTSEPTKSSIVTPTNPRSDEPVGEPIAKQDPVKIDTSKAPKPPVVLKRSNDFHWAPSRQEALKRAKRTGGYVLLVFQTSWSGQCVIMNREAFHDKGIAKTLSKAQIVPIDVDTKAGLKLSEEYKAEEIPNFVFLRPDGTVFGQFFGFMNTEWLQREVKRVFDTAKQKG